MDNERIDKLIIWKLLEDNKILWDDNFQLVEELDMLESMLDSMEACYDVMIGELQEENDRKDQYIKSLEDMIRYKK